MEELELRQYWRIIRKRLTLVISTPIIAAILSAVASFFLMTPQYEASTTLLVNQKTTSDPALQYQTVLASQAMVKTYSDIIKSATIEQSVIKDLNLPYTVGQVDSMVSVDSPDQSQVISVHVTNSSEVLATKIANSLAIEFQKRAQTLMDVQNVQVVDQAVANPNAAPVKPNKKLNIAIALVLGLMISVGLAFLLDFLDNRIRTDDDVKRYLNLPILGVIAEYAEDGDFK